MRRLEKGVPPPSTITDPPDSPPEGELAEEVDPMMLTSGPSKLTEATASEVRLLAPTPRGRPCDPERSATAERVENEES